MALILDLKDQAFYAFRSLCALLCEAIYPVIGFAYDLFIKLATFELLEPDTVTGIYKRVTMILTIIMVFYITFEFVKYIVQPDTMTDKEKGVSHLPVRVVSVVLLIAFVPHVFEYANKLQNAIIKNEVISKIILEKQNITVSTFGRNFAWTMLNLFYYEEFPGSEDDCDGVPCETVILMNESDLLNKGKLTYLTLGINGTGEIEEEIGSSGSTQSIEKPLIHFDALWAVLVGGFIAYMLISYCVDVGARVIQIAYLQLIAPIPIVGMLSPKKDNMFTKWLKQCAITYLDVFIRLAIIYFILLICQIMLNSEIKENVADADIYVKIALILGLLVFAKRVPKMISELLPKSSSAASGNFGLKPGDRNLGRVIGSALGLTAGTVAGAASGLVQGARKVKSLDPNASRGRKAWAAISGGVTGTVRGGLGGAGRGLINGSKKGNIVKNVSTGVKNQLKSNQTFGNKAEAGYTIGHQLQDKVGGMFGASRVEEHEKAKAPLERKLKAVDEVQKGTKEFFADDNVNKVKNGKGNGNAVVRRANKRLTAAEDRLKNLTTPDTELSKEFQVGKLKHDVESRKKYNQELSKRNADISKIDTDAYRNSIDEKTLGIDMNKFKKYDRQGRPRGLDMDAYNVAIEEAKTRKVEEYRKQEIAKIDERFKENVKDCVYSTEEEAKRAHTNAIEISRQEVHDAEDAAKQALFYDSVILGNDIKEKQKYDVMIDGLDLYNKYAVGHEIARDTEINEKIMAEASKVIAKYKNDHQGDPNAIFMDMTEEKLLDIIYHPEKYSADSKSDPKGLGEESELAKIFDAGLFVNISKLTEDWAKKDSITNYTAPTQAQVMKENAEIERIKRETSGSSNKS